MSTKNVHHIAGAVRGWNLNLMLSQIDNNKNERFWFNISNIRYENVVVASENFTFSNFFSNNSQAVFNSHSRCSHMRIIIDVFYSLMD